MAQLLSTFTPLEQSRFEAFRRSTFRSNAISKYVAYCLTRAEERRNARSNHKHKSRMTTSRLHQPSSLPIRELKDLVAPKRSYIHDNNSSHSGNHSSSHTAQEITIIVSTLAKCYAQRLVTASRKLASNPLYSNALTTPYPESKKLLPEHIRDAYDYRVRRSLDPGFFMQPPPHMTASSASAGNSKSKGIIGSSCLLNKGVTTGAIGRMNLSSFNGGGYGAIRENDKYELCNKQYNLELDAALAAQKAFDEHTGFAESEEKKEDKDDSETPDEMFSLSADETKDENCDSNNSNGDINIPKDDEKNESSDLEKNESEQKITDS